MLASVLFTAVAALPAAQAAQLLLRKPSELAGVAATAVTVSELKSVCEPRKCRVPTAVTKCECVNGIMETEVTELQNPWF